MFKKNLFFVRNWLNFLVDLLNALNNNVYIYLHFLIFKHEILLFCF